MIKIIKKVMKKIEKNQMTKQMGEQSLDLRSFMFHTITYALAFCRSWPVLIFFSLNFSHSENSILSSSYSHMSPSLQQQSLCPVTLGTLFLEIFDERIHWRRSVSVFVSVQIMGNKF